VLDELKILNKYIWDVFRKLDDTLFSPSPCYVAAIQVAIISECFLEEDGARRDEIAMNVEGLSELASADDDLDYRSGEVAAHSGLALVHV